MAIEDLTNQLKVFEEQLEQDGDSDFQLSEITCNEYVGRIMDWQQVLKDQRAKAAGLQEIDYPGGYESAQITKNRLKLNVAGPVGILEILDKYIEYLDALTCTVKAACKQIQAEC